MHIFTEAPTLTKEFLSVFSPRELITKYLFIDFIVDLDVLHYVLYLF